MTEKGRSIAVRVAPLVTLLFLTAACSAHLVSTHVPETPAGSAPAATEGMFYTLPQTVVTVTVPAKMTITKAGEFAEFAPLFFFDEAKDSLLKDERKLTFKPATFATRGEPDPDQVYYVKATGRGAVDQSLTFAFTEQGAVTGLKAEVTNKTADIVLAAVGGVTKILSGTVLGFAGDGTGAARKAGELGKDIECPDASTEGTPITDVNETKHFQKCFLETRHELFTPFAELQTDDQHKPLLEAYRGLPADPTKTGSSKCGDTDLSGSLRRRCLYQARDAYDLLENLVVGRNDVLKEPSLTGDGTSAVIDKNEAAAKSLMELFLGKKTELESSAVFELLPGRKPSECPTDRQMPCALWTSDPFLTYVDQGFCNRAEFDGLLQPGPKFFAKKEDCDHGRRKTLGLKLGLDPEQDQLVKRVAANYRQPDSAGLFYLVPAQMRAEVIDSGAGPDDGDRGSARLMIAQHGIVSALPSKMGGKSLTHDLTFYEASGALKSYSLVSTAMIDKGMVDSISNSANTLIEARNKQIEAEREAADEAKQLAAQRQLLEDLVKIQEACAKLENPTEGCP